MTWGNPESTMLSESRHSQETSGTAKPVETQRALVGCTGLGVRRGWKGTGNDRSWVQSFFLWGGGDRNALKRLVAMAAQLCEHNETTELSTFNGWVIWYASYISIKSSHLKNPTSRSNCDYCTVLNSRQPSKHFLKFYEEYHDYLETQPHREVTRPRLSGRETGDPGREFQQADFIAILLTAAHVHRGAGLSRGPKYWSWQNGGHDQMSTGWGQMTGDMHSISCVNNSDGCLYVLLWKTPERTEISVGSFWLPFCFFTKCYTCKRTERDNVLSFFMKNWWLVFSEEK